MATTLTAQDFAAQMIAQARILDPSISAEIGTPERKIIDTVAQALANTQVDLTGLSSGLNVDAKYGTNLDRFTALFGFQRQQATFATGYVDFTRLTPAGSTVTIPAGTLLQASSSVSTAPVAQFTTTQTGTIAVGQTDSGAVAVQCTVAGAVGNVAANTITQMVGVQPVVGVTAVTNNNAIINGLSVEDDNSYKVRFKNTVFRNLAGTTDQYLALAVAGTFTTKANVIGPLSRYLEYTQIPDFDDAGYLGGVFTQGGVPPANTNGAHNQWTTAQSIIPYAKQIYTQINTYVGNGTAASGEAINYFFRPGVDFTFNYPPVLAGDTLRDNASTQLTSNTVLPSGTIEVTSTEGFTDSGYLYLGGQLIVYTSIDDTDFLGCTGGTGLRPENSNVFQILPGQVTGSIVAPNFTFLNVYNPPAGTVLNNAVQAVVPGDVVLTEYSYVSSSSRNDVSRNITNCVDVFVDGDNLTQSSVVFLWPTNPSQWLFNSNPSSPYYYENYRRDGEATKRPNLGNVITPLFNVPADALPQIITLNGTNYYLGIHYWLVHEIGANEGSIRARDAIEWLPTLGGDPGEQPPPLDYNNNDYTNPDYNLVSVYLPTGPEIGTQEIIEVDNYEYDANIVVMQGAMEQAKQITTDVLVHKALTRYFKLDITVIYSPNSEPTVVNTAIGASVTSFLGTQYFGSIMRLSDLLAAVYSLTSRSGLDNVRWSNDVSTASVPNPPDLIRVLETDVNGFPLHGISSDRLVYGTSSSAETQNLFLVGTDFGDNDTFTLAWQDVSVALTEEGLVGASVLDITTNAPLPTSGFLHFSNPGQYDPPYTLLAFTSSTSTTLTLAAPLAQAWPLGSMAQLILTTDAISYNQVLQDAARNSVSTLQTAIDGALPGSGLYSTITASLLNRPTTNVTTPIVSWTLTFGNNGKPVLPLITNTITQSSLAYDTDFYLRDDELPSLPTGPALPTDIGGIAGLIIRPRAQSTWLRPGLS